MGRFCRPVFSEFKVRIKYIITFLMIFSISSAYADTENVDKLVNEAVTANKNINAMQYEITAGESRQIYAGSLKDPMVSLGYINEGFQKITLGDQAMSRFTLMVSQMFPYPGKLAQKVNAEKYATMSAEDRVKQEKLNISDKVRSDYLDLYSIQESKKLLNSKIAFLKMLESASASKYRSGTGGSSDVLMIQAERYMVSEELEMLAEKDKMVKADLAYLTGRDKADFGDFALLPDVDLKRSVDELYNLALDGSYSLKASRDEINGMDADVKMKTLEKYPDFTLNAGYEPRFSDTMPDVWSLSVSFNVPVYYKTLQLPAINEAKANKLKAETAYSNLKLEIKSSVTALAASADSSDRIMKLYKSGIIAKSNQARDAAIAAYSSGTMDVTGVIAAVNNAIDYEIKYLGKYAERQKSISALNTLTGGKIYGTPIN